MAKQKNYNNYAEVVGNVVKVYQTPSEKNGDMRFTLATNHKYAKKDGSEGRSTTFLNVHVGNVEKRAWIKKDTITKGTFIRVIGYLENNSYKDAEGNWKGGIEIGANMITLLKAREDGKVENTETGEVETLEDE